MKILHTADWHLCDRLGPIDRTKSLRSRVERVAELCQEHAVDVLLIAGDLFSEQAQVEHMTESLRHLHKTFASFFARGGTVLAITGNHDRDGRINMVRAGMTLASPVAGQDGNLPTGRMYLVNGRVIAWITSPAGLRVQFVLVPYPFANRYDLSATEYRSKDEENRLLHGLVASWVRDVVTGPSFDATLPTVLTAHLAVRGAELGGLSKFVLTERDDVMFDFADLNPGWAYVALGHIHKPQAVSGQANVRYPGSLDRLDFGETHDDHGVCLVEIGRTGLVREPERLPIPATPFYTIVLNDPETELPLLAERYPDREKAIVNVTVEPGTNGLSRDEIARELRRLFPQLHILKWAETEQEDATDTIGFTPRASVASTVRDYLASKLADDGDRDDVLALAEGFLKDGGES